MDNDNKVKITNPQEIHEKVMLFLGDELDLIHKKSVDQLYNIETEYSKTKKNRSPYTIIVLAICCVVVFGIAYLMSKSISNQNKEISVSLDEFEDLNLRSLLDTVSSAQANYDNAVKNKAMIEADMETKLKNEKNTYDNEVFVLDSMNISIKRRYNQRLAEIKAKYNANVKAIHDEYDSQILLANKEVESYKSQLAEFDAAKVKAAKEQEKALDTERKLREIEEKKITEKYEKRISELNEKNSDMRKKHTDEIRNSVASVSQRYQAEIDALDPTLTDEKADLIIQSVSQNQNEDLDIFAFLNEQEITDENLNAMVNNYNQLYEDYKYLDDAVASIPQKNSIPLYVSTTRQLVNEMGETYLETTVNHYKETVNLNNRIKRLNDDIESNRVAYEQKLDNQRIAFTNEINNLNDVLESERIEHEQTLQNQKAEFDNKLENERYKNEQNLNNQKTRYESCYETMMATAKTSAIITKAEGYDLIEVYVTPKARYLITEEGADAEIKTELPIKGKIHRDINDNFYFEIGADEEGNKIEVDFSTVIPGLSIKILSD